jgi:NAD(P)-dependent dehydrogenase (short-subunit alcohol dehydrogenase family)
VAHDPVLAPARFHRRNSDRDTRGASRHTESIFARRPRRCHSAHESIAGAKSRSVKNRPGEIDDVVPLVGFRCQPEQAWITAQTIRVNGSRRSSTNPHAAYNPAA